MDRRKTHQHGPGLQGNASFAGSLRRRHGEEPSLHQNIHAPKGAG